ncbi:MAG TPA: methyltransferase domain-containing protein [Candidatus Dormibacteraeota bacterium]|nr:methyltransferase domain-containing protein [Candidatus Dormibacteraeota bacterium]
MKTRLLELLACPLCHGELDLEAGRREGDEVVEGRFECRECHQGYPLLRGVPRLLPPDIGMEQERTASAFGWQWRHFVEMHPEYEEQFLDWIHPLRPEFFAGKRVLDAGCGIGRHAYFAARYGAAEVVAMDLSAAVETAREVLADLPNAHVVQGDIHHPPFRLTAAGGDFDFVYSIGVLHHLPDPHAGFTSLLRFVRPGGTIFGWVYGHENNGVVHHFIDPLRRAATARLPRPAVNAISWPMAVVLQGLVKGVYGPLEGTAVGRRLPSAAYLASLSRFGFRQNHTIVFDHLVAPTAFYLRREEYAAWFEHAGLEDVEITWRNANSWRGRGRKPQTARVPAT